MATIDRIRVRFTSYIRLPRFDFQIDDEWEVRRSKITQEGFPVGGGFVDSDKYVIIRS